MEDELKIFKVEYLRNSLLDLPQILNLSSVDRTKINNAWNEDNLFWNITSTFNKWNMWLDSMKMTINTIFENIDKYFIGKI